MLTNLARAMPALDLHVLLLDSLSHLGLHRTKLTTLDCANKYAKLRLAPTLPSDLPLLIYLQRVSLNDLVYDGI